MKCADTLRAANYVPATFTAGIGFLEPLGALALGGATCAQQHRLASTYFAFGSCTTVCVHSRPHAHLKT
jgi:hypothetical protein